MEWRDILACWPLIERDLLERYGLDVEAPDLLERRSSRWLRNKILGLLDDRTRLAARLIETNKLNTG